jgi:hypothetical protein
LADSKQIYSLTDEKIQCGHCTVNVFMKIVCEGAESYEIGDDCYGYDDFHDKWKVLKCLACSKINIIKYSSSSAWEYDIDDTTSQPIIYEEILYPPSQYSVTPLDLRISSSIVEQAIANAEALIASCGPASGVDRIHTALHGYLRVSCIQAGIVFSKDDNISKLFKSLCIEHPKLKSLDDQPQHIDRLLKSFAGILDALNPIRNRERLAHPNEHLLGKYEAMLFINVVRVLLKYLDEKLSA